MGCLQIGLLFAEGVLRGDGKADAARFEWMGPSHKIRVRFRMCHDEVGFSKIGDPVAQLLLTCFHYNPTSGRYNMNVMVAMRLAGALTVAVIGGFLIVNLRRERRQKA